MSSGYAIIDVETTGLHPGYHHRIIELAIVHLDHDGNITDEWCSLFDPERDLGPQHIHGITAAETRRAPTFTNTAGDIIDYLAGRVLVAHNLSFDLKFLQAEFRRSGVTIETTHEAALCTMHMAARFLPLAGRSLASCCRQAAVSLTHAHSALHDARAAAGLMSYYINVAGRPVPWKTQISEAAAICWPALAGHKAAPVRRRSAPVRQPDFLTRLVDRLPSVPDDPRTDDYLAVLDSALVDRHLSESEQDDLLDVASDLGLTIEHVTRLHQRYMAALATTALADGVLTKSERADLKCTANLLGLTDADVEGALTAAGTGCNDSRAADRTNWGPFRLAQGDLVVFTGDMAITRDEWHARAIAAGLSVNGGAVTKSTRLVVAADPDSPSGKARKARDYKLPIVTEDAFENLLHAMHEEGA